MYECVELAKRSLFAAITKNTNRDLNIDLHNVELSFPGASRFQTFWCGGGEGGGVTVSSATARGSLKILTPFQIPQRRASSEFLTYAFPYQPLQRISRIAITYL